MRLKDWRSKFTSYTLEKSHKYLNNRVSNYKIDGRTVTGVVHGTKNMHNVSFDITPDREVVNLKCDCYLAQEGNNCKHMAGLISYYELLNRDENEITPSAIYHLDLPELIAQHVIAPESILLLENRDNIPEITYRFFDVKVNGETFYEIVGDKYLKDKGRLFINNNLDFFVLDVSLRDSKYAIYDIVMAAKKLYPVLVNKLLKKFDESRLIENKKNSLIELSNDFRKETFRGELKLIPTLDLKTKSVSYKIATNRQFSIKDLVEFSKAILDHDVLTYSKTTFIHGYEYFDKKSKKHLDFILYNTRNVEGPMKSIKLDNRYAVDFFFGTLKNQTVKVDGEGDVLVSVSNQVATITLDSNHMSLFDYKKIIFVGNLGVYYKNDNIIEYRKFTNNRVKDLFLYLHSLGGTLDILDVNDTFIAQIFPMIKDDITIYDSFNEKFKLPKVVINTYLKEEKKDIITLNYQVLVNGEEMPANCNDYVYNTFLLYEKILLDNYFFEKKDNAYVLTDLKDQYNLLCSSLIDVKNYGQVYFDEAILTLKPKPRRNFSISASFNVNMLELKLINFDYSKEDLASILEGYKKKQKYIKLKSGSIIELNESYDYIRELIDDFKIDLDEDFNSIKRPMSFAFKLLNHEGYDLEVDNELSQFFTRMTNYKNKKYYIPEELDSKLKPYQVEANSWLNALAEFGFGGILADDMGLGKTIEMISMLLGDDKKMPSLVVCPMSLVYNWQQEIIKWNVNIKCIPVVGLQPIREEIIKAIDSNEKIIYVTSYDSLRRDLNLYSDVKFRFIIADEAQYIKNQFTQKAGAIKTLNSDIRFALTGTPIENGLQDMWSIFDFIAPGYLSSYQAFRLRYENLIVSKDENALRRLRSKLMPFILRRTKKDVLKDLPEKIENVYYTQLNKEEQMLYDACLIDLKEKLENNEMFVVLSMLMRLRQTCVEPKLWNSKFTGTSSKLLLCLDIVKTAISGDHKVLIFSQFTSVFPHLEELLKAEGITFRKITGDTKAEERIRLVNEFNETDINVMLISLKAGGTGLNLQSADTVIHLDPWWNVSAENQATDRAHRIGQQNTVNVIKLVAKNTIEDKVLELQTKKKNLADSILDYASVDKFSIDQIKNLID